MIDLLLLTLLASACAGALSGLSQAERVRRNHPPTPRRPTYRPRNIFAPADMDRVNRTHRPRGFNQFGELD